MGSNDPRAARYQQAKSIALRALDMSEPERAAFLDQACGGDDPLREETLWLIRAAEDDADEHVVPDLGLGLGPVASAAFADPESLSVDAPSARNYRLLRRLGEGGMGVVHLAERVDGGLQQQLALKLLRLEIGSDAAMARRFAGERRILAGLNHKNIAHLIDAGISTDGRLFLAMEYVDGERIDVWCEQQRLDLNARIELFLKVCDAIEYAHQHLVIHRDIKPANILVGADGEPKLLDFGIARLLSVDADLDRVRTDTGLRALTLAYASPEQIEGGPLGTATDVYSLGIVLYQLVTGVRPFDHLQTAHLLSNAIVSGEITPPSRQAARPSRGAGDAPLAADPAAGDGQVAEAHKQREPATGSWWSRFGRRRVPRDIDAIVLKALRRTPAQRYGSVAGMAADLRRFLQSRPVRARRGHWPYRMRRFAWRWRWALAAVITFAGLLIGFMLERESQLQRTQVERDRAEALAGFMNDLFENADSLRSRGNEVTVRELLDRGAQELLARDDLERSLRHSMLLAMGRAYNALGLGQQALPLLESAIELLPETTTTPRERAHVLGHLSQAYSNSWRTADSIAADTEAIALLGADADADEILRLRIRKLHNQANLLDAPLAESTAELHAIVDALEARSDPPHALLMQAYRALTVAYSHPDTPTQAMAMAERTLAIAERHYRNDDPRLLSTRFVHAMVVGQSDPARAVEAHERLIADYQRLVGPGMSLAAVHSNLGVTLSMLGRHADSLAEFERAAGIIRATGGTDNTLYRITMLNIATFHGDHDNPSEAERLVLEQLPLFEAAVSSGGGGDRSNLAQVLRVLASARHRMGRLDAAEASYVDASDAMTASDVHAHPHVMAGVLLGLADVRLQRGRIALAAETLDRFDAVNSGRNLPPNDPIRFNALVLRAELRIRREPAAAIAPLIELARALACETSIDERWRSRLAALEVRLGPPAPDATSDHCAERARAPSPDAAAEPAPVPM